MVMALQLPLASVPSTSFIRPYSKGIANASILHISVLQPTKIVATTNASDPKIVRRSANYHPPIWEYDCIQSLKSDYLGASCNERVMGLVGEVRLMLNEVMDPLEKLELLDSLQRLGLSHHFENETKRILESIRVDQRNVSWKKDNLYATAPEFRLLGQHGYKVNQEIFSSFVEKGKFRADLCEDCKGLLSLYEASYLSVEGESILDNARDFAAKHLKEYLKQSKDQYLSLLVEHSFGLPLHWRMQRLEARWFIDVFERKEDRNPIHLQLAILDFNYVQAVHQDDLKYVSNWCGGIGVAEKPPFAREKISHDSKHPTFGSLL